MDDCLFCKIANKEVESEIIYDGDKVIVFKDISPKAPLHYLIVPKTHIESIKIEGSEEKVADLVKAAKKIAQDSGIEGYKLKFHVGREGGQLVDHLHMHFMAEKALKTSL